MPYRGIVPAAQPQAQPNTVPRNGPGGHTCTTEYRPGKKAPGVALWRAECRTRPATGTAECRTEEWSRRPASQWTVCRTGEWPPYGESHAYTAECHTLAKLQGCMPTREWSPAVSLLESYIPYAVSLACLTAHKQEDSHSEPCMPHGSQAERLVF
ncbi:hypothetical protein B0T24DRAFT_20388 [Lasiosphaeria ovina]|uniref:Uncharacterized protein n=1 Tax=Lasiosphaeria ovina TaxID=92902 RepID=A0AAE0NJN1_9PEZI|nr:hypothetical protein B0T24DRAFT_20388 [Lasiosphaeria ovina]